VLLPVAAAGPGRGLRRKCLYLVRPWAFGPGVGAAGARRAPCVSGKELDGPERMMRPALPSWQILTRAPGPHLTWHRKDDRIVSSCCFSPRVQRDYVTRYITQVNKQFDVTEEQWYLFIYRSKHTGGVVRQCGDIPKVTITASFLFFNIGVTYGIPFRLA
jgi:hypothetical protein